MVEFSTHAALFILVILLGAASYRIWVGPTHADRLQALELATTFFIGSVVILGIVLDSPMFIDLGIALAAFSFVATLAIARYIAEGDYL